MIKPVKPIKPAMPVTAMPVNPVQAAQGQMGKAMGNYGKFAGKSVPGKLLQAPKGVK